jgi:nitrogen regulatory protein PII
MKRVEVVMTSSGLDMFKSSAVSLGILEFDVSDVRLSPSVAVKERRRLYRGQEYTLDLLPRVKVEFALLDEDAKPIVQNFLTLVTPDSIAIFPLDQLITMSSSVDQRGARSRSERGYTEVRNVVHH